MWLRIYTNDFLWTKLKYHIPMHEISGSSALSPLESTCTVDQGEQSSRGVYWDWRSTCLCTWDIKPAPQGVQNKGCVLSIETSTHLRRYYSAVNTTLTTPSDLTISLDIRCSSSGSAWGGGGGFGSAFVQEICKVNLRYEIWIVACHVEHLEQKKWMQWEGMYVCTRVVCVRCVLGWPNLFSEQEHRAPEARDIGEHKRVHISHLLIVCEPKNGNCRAWIVDPAVKWAR